MVVVVEVKGVSKAHIPVVDHVLKKPHVSNYYYRKNGDFNPTYHDWLGVHKKYIYRVAE